MDVEVKGSFGMPFFNAPEDRTPASAPDPADGSSRWQVLVNWKDAGADARHCFQSCIQNILEPVGAAQEGAITRDTYLGWLPP